VTRINLVLLGVLIACALALVSSQHHARRLFTELEKEQELAKQIDIEWGQLQLEQSTWATHGRVERIAIGELTMITPQPSDLRIVQP
jgi:cell division protein FtsL